MIPALDKVTILMTLTRQLIQVLEAESEALRRLDLVELPDLQAERLALADIHRAELLDMRKRPEILGALHADCREELEFLTRHLQESSRRHAVALRTAEVVVERAMRMIGESLAETPRRPLGGPGLSRGEVVPFELDRRS